MMKDKIYALDLDRSEWTVLLSEEFGQPGFRADQMCQWIWEKKIFDIDAMTNLSKPLREELKNKIDIAPPLLIKEERSVIDGTRKYLWQLHDGESVESVLIRQGERFTACVSTQVGCPLGCAFCATGLSGFERNLSAGEIAGQFLAMEKIIGRDINNVVYMGMGEPFMNTEAVIKSAEMLKDPKMRNLGVRHIVISTSGVVPGILELAGSKVGVRLAVSLHAAEDGLRSSFMPINETYPLSELKSAMKEYQRITGDRITIEYTLFGGLNDSVEHARGLVRYLTGIHVFINLIPYNLTDSHYRKPRPEDVLKFRSVLETAGFEADIREERGSDISAACGQLRKKNGVDAADKPEHGRKTHQTETDKNRRQSRIETERKDTVREIKAQSPRTAERNESRHRTASRVIKSSDIPRDGERAEKTPFSPKKRRTASAPKERYRSGKMKEERPTLTSEQEGKSTNPSYGRKGTAETKVRKKSTRPLKKTGAAARPDGKRRGTSTKGKEKKGA